MYTQRKQADGTVTFQTHQAWQSWYTKQNCWTWQKAAAHISWTNACMPSYLNMTAWESLPFASLTNKLIYSRYVTVLEFSLPLTPSVHSDQTHDSREKPAFCIIIKVWHFASPMKELIHIIHVTAWKRLHFPSRTKKSTHIWQPLLLATAVLTGFWHPPSGTLKVTQSWTRFCGCNRFPAQRYMCIPCYSAIQTAARQLLGYDVAMLYRSQMK